MLQTHLIKSEIKERRTYSLHSLTLGKNTAYLFAIDDGNNAEMQAFNGTREQAISLFVDIFDASLEAQQLADVIEDTRKEKLLYN